MSTTFNTRRSAVATVATCLCGCLVVAVALLSLPGADITQPLGAWTLVEMLKVGFLMAAPLAVIAMACVSLWFAVGYLNSKQSSETEATS